MSSLLAETLYLEGEDAAAHYERAYTAYAGGGPSLAGVLVVHMGPGVVAAVVGLVLVRRWIVRRRTRPSPGTAP